MSAARRALEPLPSSLCARALELPPSLCFAPARSSCCILRVERNAERLTRLTSGSSERRARALDLSRSRRWAEAYLPPECSSTIGPL
eukprot:619425-Prymnesium_polylepis.1